MKRTLLAVAAALTLISASAEGLQPYVGIYGASDSHDKTLYENTSSYNGVSIGLRYALSDSVFLRAELAGTEHDANPNIGLGYKVGGFLLAGGIGSGQERANYNFSGSFPPSFDTSKFTFTFVEAEYKGGFIRYQYFPTKFNFSSTYTTLDQDGNPDETFNTAKTVHESRGVFQIGYRYNF